jgi:hypothetical protein
MDVGRDLLRRVRARALLDGLLAHAQSNAGLCLTGASSDLDVVHRELDGVAGVRNKPLRLLLERTTREGRRRIDDFREYEYYAS